MIAMKWIAAVFIVTTMTCLLTPSLQNPLPSSTTATADTSTASTSSITTATATTLDSSSATDSSSSSSSGGDQCPSGQLQTSQRLVAQVCAVESKAQSLKAVYVQYNPTPGDPITDANLRSALTARDKCRQSVHTQLDHYRGVLKQLQGFYDDEFVADTYLTPLTNLLDATENLQQVLRRQCSSSSPAQDCSAMNSNSASSFSVSFNNVDDGHDWGYTLTTLLLQRLQNLSEDGSSLCVRRRRNSDAAGKGKGKKRGRLTRQLIQQQVELQIADDLSQLMENGNDDDDDADNNNKAVTNFDNNDMDGKSDNNNDVDTNNAVGKDVVDKAVVSPQLALSSMMAGKKMGRQGTVPARRRKNKRRGRKNRRKGRKNKGRGRKNKGKGRKNKKDRRQKRRKGNKKRGDKSKRRNRVNGRQ